MGDRAITTRQSPYTKDENRKLSKELRDRVVKLQEAVWCINGYCDDRSKEVIRLIEDAEVLARLAASFVLKASELIVDDNEVYYVDTRKGNS